MFFVVILHTFTPLSIVFVSQVAELYQLNMKIPKAKHRVPNSTLKTKVNKVLAAWGQVPSGAIYHGRL